MKIQLPQGAGIVALSGGADSVALLRLAHAASADVLALHCNFHLRGEESDRDERFVRQLCATLGVELRVKHFDTQAYAKEKGQSIEMAARELRYAWFEEVRSSEGRAWLAVAHHREDQAETVLLNLIRGTGTKGLGGMRPRNGHIVRPLLDYSKDEILQYLQAIGQDYVTDSTNMQRDAQRNRLRLDVIPLLRAINPQAVEHICQTAALMQSMQEMPKEGEYTLASLYEWLHPYGFSLQQQRDILRDIHGPSGAVYESPTHQLLRNRGELVLEVKGEPVLPTIEQSIVETDAPLDFLRSQPLDARHAYLDADKLQLPLQHRFVQTGDAFCPFGMKGRRLLSDFLTDQKLNLFEKRRQSVMLSGEDIVWVVGLRADNRFRVSEQTRHILQLSIIH